MAPGTHKRVRKPTQKVKESQAEDTRRKASGRANFSQEVRRILKEHYEENTRSDKHLLRLEREKLASKTGLTGEQVAQWYVNHRRRRGKVSNNNPPRSEAAASREEGGEKGQSSWPPELNPEVHFPQPIPRHGCRCVPPVVPKSINFRDRSTVKRLLNSLIVVESDKLEMLAKAVMLDNYVDRNLKRLEEKTVEDALMLVQNKAHMIWCK